MKAKYIAITRVDLQQFVIDVNELIKEGYRPLGGMSSTTIHINNITGDLDRNGVEHVQYSQALVLPELLTQKSPL